MMSDERLQRGEFEPNAGILARQVLRDQVEQGRAVAFFAAALAIAVLLSVSVTEHTGLIEARQQADKLRAAIAAENQVFRENERALENVQKALEQLKGRSAN